MSRSAWCRSVILGSRSCTSSRWLFSMIFSAKYDVDIVVLPSGWSWRSSSSLLSACAPAVTVAAADFAFCTSFTCPNPPDPRTQTVWYHRRRFGFLFASVLQEAAVEPMRNSAPPRPKRREGTRVGPSSLPSEAVANICLQLKYSFFGFPWSCSSRVECCHARCPRDEPSSVLIALDEDEHDADLYVHSSTSLLLRAWTQKIFA
mmetsp:Transcript_13852/g.34193  ORF Transcript_13852/g.34193 Transcript_13852/m.34193 type:complete len:204 (-) Transcript_13852:706-1317(-)